MSDGSRDVSAIYEALYDPDYRPKASSRAHIEKLTVDGEPAFILMKESEHEYYDVDPKTDVIWKLLDGKRTVKGVYEEAHKADGSLTEKDVKDTVVSLAEEGIIEGSEPEVRRRRVELVYAFQLDVHLLKDSSKSLAAFFRITRKLIARWELPVALGVAVVGFALFYGTFLHIFADPTVFELAGSTVLGFFFYELLVMLPVYAVHELAHASVCDYYGAKPREIGTGLYYLAPYFYCDTSDSWRLSRRARIMISLAGPLSTVTIASFLVFASYFVAGPLQNTFKVAAFFGFYGSLINFSPVIETDGYYILADVLNIPNLRDEAFGYIRRSLRRVFGLRTKVVRQSARRVRIIALYSLISVLWLAYFAYTTLWLLYVYGRDAYAAVLNIGLTAFGARTFDLTAMGVNVATVSYFGLFLVGFIVMGVVASKNIRMRGVRLETIHDKRVSAFLPFPSQLARSGGSELADRAKRAASASSHFFSVTVEPPLCVAALKLGKVDQSLEDMRGEMRRIEQTFRSLHRSYVRSHLGYSALPAKKAMTTNLRLLASQFHPREKGQVKTAVSQFLRREDRDLEFLLESAFGTVWTLELSPDDYTRVKRKIFPSLIAEDIGTTDLPEELEEFKRRTVLGSDVIAQLSSEIEEESKEVYARPEVYQLTAYLEPMKSRLVFVGRTDKVEGSVVWLGGLYLYQAWASYIGSALEDAAFGLRSVRLSRTTPLTRTQVSKLPDQELKTLDADLARMEALTKTVEGAMPKIERTFESAINFHDTLDSLVSDEAFDVGLYKPIMSTNARHLEGVREKFEGFRAEFGKVAKRQAALAEDVREEVANRKSSGTPVRFLESVRSSRVLGGSAKARTPGYDAEIRQMFAVSRLVYGPVVAADIVI